MMPNLICVVAAWSVTAVSDHALEVSAQRVARRLAPLSGEFQVVIAPPFIVVGDEPRALVERRARQTVGWAMAHLGRQFFPEPPARVLTIWLFKDADSYFVNTAMLFGESPDTPFGYYSSTHGALIMNIATGGGTLVHELVHPLVEANFPACPPWLNEGLGSLFEQASERDGKIVGLLNWRLPGLQADIRAGRTRRLAVLLGLDEVGFYGAGSGTHYAQARYLLYYLQEIGVLEAFYARVVRRQGRDPSGAESLRFMLGTDDLDAFQRRWEAWLLELG